MAPEDAGLPLDGLRVLDLTGPMGAYAGRLLADLGADVLRIEDPGGGDPCQVSPFVVTFGRATVSLFERFVNAGKRSITLDVAAPEARDLLTRLIGSADILLESDGSRLEEAGWDDEAVDVANPQLIRVVISPFGRHVAIADGDDDDLVLLGAGGLLHLGGYADAGPVAAYGQQSRYAASIFGAVATLAALIGREQSTAGVVADVSAQECIAQALEDSLPEYALTGRIRGPIGDGAREAGTGVYRCADGWVSMVAGRLGTAKAWDALVDWVASSSAPGAEQLRNEEWSDFAYRQDPEGIERFRTIFECFAADRSREELYQEAQRRRIALCPVNDMRSLLRDAQLGARGFFAAVDDPVMGTLTYPGVPYRLHGSPRRLPGPAPVRGADNGQVYLRELGIDREALESLMQRGVV